MKKYSKSIINIKNRRVLLAVVLCIAVLASLIFFTRKAAAESSRDVYRYYTSYEIQPGDTLWSIADQFMGPEFQNRAEFIENVKKINHLSTDNITAGKYLVIEYSSFELL